MQVEHISGTHIEWRAERLHRIVSSNVVKTVLMWKDSCEKTQFRFHMEWHEQHLPEKSVISEN